MTGSRDQHLEFYRALCDHVAAEIPGFEVRFKPEHTGQRILAVVLRPFVPGYLDNYTTTLYPRVYFASRAEIESHPWQTWETLAHEYVHLHDHRRDPWTFSLGYVFPQVLVLGALGAIGAIWTPWAWLCLAFLLALAPWPAPWRKHAEVRGYAMDLAVRYWHEGSAWGVRGIKEHFTGWAYYRMWPYRDDLDRIFAEILDNLHTTGLPLTEHTAPWVAVRALMARHGLLDETHADKVQAWADGRSTIDVLGPPHQNAT